MSTFGILRTLCVTLLFTVGCIPDPESSKGFRLPDGDADKGKEVYAELRCDSCHHLKDSLLPFTGTEEPIMLGGKTTRVRTYGELVTSIINPSHKLAPGAQENIHRFGEESLMEYANLNQIMTIQELIDLVAFLQGQYEVVPPDIDHYPGY